jgi:hypothetical protein
MHEEIFERFRQADSTIARQYGEPGWDYPFPKHILNCGRDYLARIHYRFRFNIPIYNSIRID